MFDKSIHNMPKMLKPLWCVTSKKIINLKTHHWEPENRYCILYICDLWSNHSKYEISVRAETCFSCCTDILTYMVNNETSVYVLQAHKCNCNNLMEIAQTLLHSYGLNLILELIISSTYLCITGLEIILLTYFKTEDFRLFSSKYHYFEIFGRPRLVV